MTTRDVSGPAAPWSSSIALSDWFGTLVRPVLEEHAPERIAEFERQLEELKTLGNSVLEPFSTCFLGQSQIGKSTLINALVAEDKILLPAGGIGPLTAQAIQVSFASTPFLEVWYQEKKKILQLIFALERQIDRQNASNGVASISAGEEVALDTEDRSDLIAVDEITAQTSAIQERIKQATLLIAGDQNESRSLKYLCDCLRLACSMQVKWQTELQPVDRRAVERLFRILRAASVLPYRVEGAISDGAFMRERHIHAAGSLAPMVRKLDIGWPSPLLASGIRLVDLPGVGIADDSHRTVTRDWIKEKANAICLVVSNGGIDESSAELLRSSEFLTRLLYSINDPEADPVVLCVVVVRMDDLALSSFERERASSPDHFRKKIEHLREVSEKIKPVICTQMKSQLERLAVENDGEARAALQDAAERLVDTLEVFPVSAREYCRLLRCDDDDRSFLKSEEDSGVPQLQESIQRMATSAQAAKQGRLDRQTTEFKDRVIALLRALRVQWTEETELAEAERLRRLLQPFLEPRKRELAARQGKFQEFLDASIPEQIELLVTQAAVEAERAMRREIRKLQHANWSTLKAVIVRGGAYYGKRPVDLPRELAAKFEEHVAPLWSTRVIGPLRLRTAALAGDYVSMVSSTVTWAEENGAGNRSIVVQALADTIRQEGKRMTQVGRNGADELRELVKRQLQEGVQEPIRKRCKRFAESEAAHGAGVKQRMLRFFENEILEVVIDAARPPATRILKENYAVVREEIVECFRQFSHPLDDVEEKIVGKHLDGENKSKAHWRECVLSSIDAALLGAFFDR